VHAAEEIAELAVERDIRRHLAVDLEIDAPPLQ
jgi:hypothetical protein